MNGRDFLTVAISLAAGTTEAYWRSSIGRSYYAAFHVARGLLRRLGFVVPASERAHMHLYLRLNNCGIPAVELIASQLKVLRNLRNDADYNENCSIDSQQADE